MIRVLLVDDHQLVLDGLKAILLNEPDIELVGAVNSAEAALEYLDHLSIDLVMTDVDMPGMSGVDLAKVIRKNQCPVKILVLTMHNEKSIIKQIMQVGADGYILKTTPQNEMLAAIRKVLAGEKYFSADVTLTLLSSEPALNDSVVDLTEREIEVLKLIAEGHTNKEIGEALFISHRTADAHRTNMMKKLEINNVAGLVRYAMKNGFIS